MKKTALAALAVALTFAVFSCKKKLNTSENTSSSHPTESNSLNSKVTNIINPLNSVNSFDLRGQGYFHALEATVSNSSPYLGIDSYLKSNPISMFNTTQKLSSAEYNFLLTFNTAMENPNSANGRVNTAQSFEKKIANSNSFTSQEKERLFTIVSIIKYSYYFEDVYGLKKSNGDYYLYTMNKLGLDNVKLMSGVKTTVNINSTATTDPTLRTVCEDMGVTGQNGQCARTWYCKKKFIGITIGKPWIEVESVPCPDQI